VYFPEQKVISSLAEIYCKKMLFKIRFLLSDFGKHSLKRQRQIIEFGVLDRMLIENLKGKSKNK